MPTDKCRGKVIIGGLLASVTMAGSVLLAVANPGMAAGSAKPANVSPPTISGRLRRGRP
jgi:hypothetical protein